MLVMISPGGWRKIGPGEHAGNPGKADEGLPRLLDCHLSGDRRVAASHCATEHGSPPSFGPLVQEHERFAHCADIVDYLVGPNLDGDKECEIIQDRVPLRGVAGGIGRRALRRGPG